MTSNATTQTEAPLLTETQDGVATLTLNRPGQFNALSSALIEDMQSTFDRLAADPTVRVVVLSANGRGFCAGHAIGDRDAYPEFAASFANIGKNWIGSRELFLWPTLRFFAFPKPMIAQVHGYALGGGTYWAFLPDITIASEQGHALLANFLMVAGLSPRRRNVRAQRHAA